MTQPLDQVKEKTGELKQPQNRGIDFPRAYQSLIKGYVEIYTQRRLKELEHLEERGDEK